VPLDNAESKGLINVRSAMVYLALIVQLQPILSCGGHQHGTPLAGGHTQNA
jgi:hypothetical protein